MLFPQTINAAMQKDTEELNIGVLDIYGFEIFQVSCMMSQESLSLVATPVVRCFHCLVLNSVYGQIMVWFCCYQAYF